MNLSNLIKIVKKNNFLRYGLPFIMFIFGGSFVLREFASVRYEVSRHKKQLGLTPELLKEFGYEVKSSTIEDEYKTMIKTKDIENWKNIRAPRPWEEDSKQYKDVIEQRIAETQKKR